jgi:hypothetical protein
MKLPNASVVEVEREKNTEYLLNTGHRYGASKAKFFRRFGFSVASWKMLGPALQEHGRKFEVSKVTETIFGPRYEVERVEDTRWTNAEDPQCLATGSRNGCASPYHGLSSRDQL